MILGLVMVGGLLASLSDGARDSGNPRTPIGALGFPIDAAGLADARLALSELRGALAGPDDARVATAPERLEARLRSLDPVDRRAVERESQVLFAQAVARLGGVRIDDGSGTPPPSATDSNPDAGPAKPPAGSQPSPSVSTAPGSSAGSGTPVESEDATSPELVETEPTVPPEPPGS